MDFVVPMVFDDDPLWRNDYLSLRRVYHRKAYYSFYFRSWGLEHLLIKAVKRFMPFIETIHVLLARESQIKDWMIDEGVHVVLHEDFIPKEFLPTFNANTIEMFLHRIPMLSEEFIYGNDDVFPLSPFFETCFFDKGLPCQHYFQIDYPKEPNTFNKFCMSGLNMIAADFGQKFTDKWLVGGHSLSPFLKETCEEVWERYGDKIMASITKERSEINYNQYIFAFYQYFTKRYIGFVPPRTFICAAMPTDKIRSVVNRDNVGVVCINDHDIINDFDERRETIYSILKNKIEN